jgi:hypothetical protein
MKRSITELIQERFGDPIGSYARNAPVGVRSVEKEDVCPTCGMEDCECDHMNEAESCSECGMMPLEGEGCGCSHVDEAEACNQCGMMPLEGEGCGCTHLDEGKKKRKKKKRGLWANIHARRKAGKRPHKPGEKGYPETLDIEK